MISYCDIQGSCGSDNWNASVGIDGFGNIDADPQFVDVDDLDGADGKLGTVDDGLGLQGDSHSHCIDAGNKNFIHEVNDIAGTQRLRYSKVDMGAYEAVRFCNGVEIIDVEYDQMNIKDTVNFGWQDETYSCDPMTFSVTFKVENSGEGCGWGTNSNQQYGYCHIIIYLPEEKAITVSVDGVVETTNPGFDRGRIYVSNNEVRMEVPYDFVTWSDIGDAPIVYIESTQYHEGQCTDMEEPLPDSETICRSGVHDFWFIVDTKDGAYHKEAEFNFMITITNP